MEKFLQDNIDPQTKLIIRSVLGADSTAEWYLGNYNNLVFDMVAD